VAPPRTIGILLLQLGTPAAPTEPALRTYLREFLSDRRVIDVPRAIWWPVLHLRVLRTRPAQSAALYRKIWTPLGSPLLRTTVLHAESLEWHLSRTGACVRVVPAMRYGEPSIAQALDELRRAGADRLLAFPMYPQYAGATTGSSLQRLYDLIRTWRTIPSVRTVPPYFDDALYLEAVAHVARATLDACPWTPDHYLISFHGLPRRYAEAGDPYPAHCRHTADRLAALLGWPADRVTMTFQSRFGREEWLRPYTDETLMELGRARARVAVICPGFTADCLETLEEIAITNRERFLEAGGRDYLYLPCVNDDAHWKTAMMEIATRELGGWL
jgi:ferrochelatase